MSSSKEGSKRVSHQLVDDFDGATDEKLRTALAMQAASHDLRYLLSHHDDGVVWGHFNGQQWLFSSDTFGGKVSPLFRAGTLQQCRAFGEKAELLVWRQGGQLRASLLVEETETDHDCFDEQQILWGTRQDSEDGFALLQEGRQGLRHAPPFPALGENENLGLCVRHYVAYDDQSGRAYIAASRLVRLEKVEANNER